MDETREAGVGARLREARESRGQSLEDIGRQTRIPVRHLVQIEEGRLEGLPAAPYSAGFVKAYARTVGLDPNAMGQSFRAEFERARRGTGRVAYEPYEPADPSRLPPRLLAVVALVIAVLLVGGYAIFRSGVLTGDGPDVRGRLAAGADARDGATADAPANSRAPAQPAGSPIAPAAPAANAPVVLTATQPVWMEISERGGATLFLGVIEQGKSYAVPATAADPVIRTGRPEGLAVTVGGRPVAPLGLPAKTIADVSLKPAALIANGFAPAATPASAVPVPTIDRPANGTPPAYGGAN